MIKERNYTQKKYVRVGDKVRVWVESMNRWSDELTVISLTPLKIIVEIPSNKKQITYYRKHFIESDQFIFSTSRPIDYDINKTMEKNDDE